MKENGLVSFIMAPHPYFVYCSLGKSFETNHDLFDLAEKSWRYVGDADFPPFLSYLNPLNRNQHLELVANKY